MMAFGEEWEAGGRDRARSFTDAGMGALRVALLFGSAAVALALIATPILEGQVDRMSYASMSPGIDMMPTGTVGQRETGSYIVRRSVLQPTPNSVCIIRGNGMRTGDC